MKFGTPVKGAFFALLLSLALSSSAHADCGSPANAIERENCLPGSPQGQWDVSGAGDPSIQGFATDISVNVGETVSFKVNTDATAYTIDIYRMGYYGGMGARLVASIQPSVQLPQVQPACLSDSASKLVDCGNWGTSASWQVPANAVSGIYFAHLIRTDTGGDSHIVFIVRNDASASSILFQTSDETWEAYNGYGGASLYGPDNIFDITNRAYKVSYNRPFDTRGFGAESATWVFGTEYPMVRFLEANGYDVSYFTGIDAARFGSAILKHKLYMTVGHDEYWSGPHRANVEAARDAGVNMAFFSGNEVFWKTRLEPSVDGSNTPNRTLVCYKETFAGTPIDPLDPSVWTGTWRDARFSPPADGGRPENSLTGTLFTVNGPGADNDGSKSIKVPYADAQMRFWRNSSVADLASGATATLPKGTLGYEWDEDVDNGFRPAGLFELSTATYNLTTDLILDQGATYGPGTATHHLTMYKAPSGALVFGAGSVQWSWGLDNHHDNPFFSPNAAASTAMRQATVNLFADMGVQPATLQSGLVMATASGDSTPPTSAITWPTDGTTVAGGSVVNVTGTATDLGGGVVGGVEISTDGGTTWHPVAGRETWTYAWRPPALRTFTLETRATDDSGNIESDGATASVVAVNPPDCPCSDWSPTTKPTQIDSGDPAGIELGVRFRADFDGYISGIRFYKASTNTGSHIGNLWSNAGTLLARATFTSETASGWQQVNFANPVAVSANTTYVASYFAPSGHYSDSVLYFVNSGSDAPPIHLLQDGVDGRNGVYSYSSTTTFPGSSFHSTNYWVDVVYVPSSAMPGAPPALLIHPATLAFSGFAGQGNPPAQNVSVYNEGDGTLSWTASSDSTWLTATPSGITPGALVVAVDNHNVNPGTYTGKITVTPSSGATGPQTIRVSFVVSNPLLLSSNFSDGTMSGWAFSPLGLASNWSVADSALQYNGGGHTQVYAGNSAWTDYDLSVAVKLATLNDYPGGIRGRVDPITGAGYAVWLYPAEGIIKLFSNFAWNIDSGITLLGQGRVTFDATSFHNVGLSFRGSQIQVLYDGSAVVTATDATHASGVVALDVSDQAINFTNVLVSAASANANVATFAPATNTLTFSAFYQGSSPATQNVGLSSTGGNLVWTATSNAPWLSASPVYGTMPSALQVSVASSTLAPGTYNGAITIIALGAVSTTQTIGITLNITVPPPVLQLTPSTLKVVALVGQPVTPQTVGVANGVVGTFNWTAATDASWLAASPANGSTPQSLNLSFNTSGLSAGTYTANLTVTAPGLANSPQTAPVTLRLLSSDLNESFADLGTGWIVSPMGHAGGWTVTNGAYSYSGAGLSQSCSGNSAWSDYVFDTNVQLTNLSNWPGGARARVNPATGAGYAVWLYPGSSKAILYKVGSWDINDASLTELAEAPLSFNTSSHDLQMDFRGTQISVSWDGTLLMSASDSTYANGFVCLDADNQPISYSNVRVAAVQNSVILDPITPASLIFNTSPGGTAAAQTINVTAGAANTTWAATANAPWLTLNASKTMTPGTLTATASASSLGSGTYNATITLSAPGASNSPMIIPVTLAVNSPALSVSPSGLTFFAATNQNPSSQTLQVTNAGTGSANWTARATSNWLSLSPGSGVAPASISVSANTAATGSGSFSDTITITSGAGTDPALVPVSLKVGSPLFSDDFSSGAGNWTISPLGSAPGWSVVNGAYTYNGGGHTQSYAGSSAWTNYTVATNFQLSSLNDYPGGLRGRVNTTSGASYGVWVYPAERVLKLFRIGQWNIDADLTLLGQSAQIATDTNWHNLRLVFQGTSISVYYDSRLVITASDSSYSQGAVALDVSNQPVSFDNVSVIALQ
jgi:hypothetical protein